MHRVTKLTKIKGARAFHCSTIVIVSAAGLMLAACSGSKSGGGNGGGNPPNQGQPQEVHLHWKSSGWKVQLNNGPEVAPADAVTALAKGTGPTKFVVDISGNSAVFDDNEPLTVWTGDKSQPKSGIEGTQILGPIFEKGGKLVFYDLNQGDPVRLNYSLHFKNGVPPVDPIMDNGGSN